MILDQVDDTADSLMESMGEVQTTIAELHSTVGDLINSMSEMLKSMAEMRATLYQPTTTESQITVDQDLPASPEKQSIAVDNSIDEKESRYIHLKKIQIEMPVFEGLNVNLWISRAERYFEIGSFTETEKLRLVYLSVDGEALGWFNFWKLREPFVDWNDFKSRVLNRFGDNLKSGSAMERLLRLKQVGSVIVYLSQFEELASQLSHESDFLFEAVFVNGLKDEIKNTLRLFQPKGINDMITKALRLENSPFCRLMNQPLDYSSSSPTDAITN